MQAGSALQDPMNARGTLFPNQMLPHPNSVALGSRLVVGGDPVGDPKALVQLTFP